MGGEAEKGRQVRVPGWLWLPIAFIIVVVAGLFFYKVEREWHWNSDYRGLVEDTIRDMVKPSCLMDKRLDIDKVE